MQEYSNVVNPYGTQVVSSRAHSQEEVQKSGEKHAEYEKRATRIKRQKFGIIAAGVIIGTTGAIGTAAEVITDPNHSLKSVPAPLFYAAAASPLVFSALYGNAKSREATNSKRMDNNLYYAFAHTDSQHIASGGTNSAAKIEPWMLSASNKDAVLAKMHWVPDATYSVVDEPMQSPSIEHEQAPNMKALPPTQQQINE